MQDRPPTSRPHNLEGFTLTEVTVAMALIALVLAGGFAALIQGNRIIEDARDVTRVAQVIQSEVEALRTMNWDDLEALTYPGLNPGSGASQRFDEAIMEIPLQGQFAAKYGDRYQLQRSVFYQDMNGDGVEDQIGVHLIVTWLSTNGAKSKSLRFYTRFTENGLNDYFYRAFPSE